MRGHRLRLRLFDLYLAISEELPINEQTPRFEPTGEFHADLDGMIEVRRETRRIDLLRVRFIGFGFVVEQLCHPLRFSREPYDGHQIDGHTIGVVDRDATAVPLDLQPTIALIACVDDGAVKLVKHNARLDIYWQ